MDVLLSYVVDSSDELLVALRGSTGRSGTKHTELTGGAPAKAAGELRLFGGSIEINNQSGRYRAQSHGAIGRVRELLRSLEKSVTITGAL